MLEVIKVLLVRYEIFLVSKKRSGETLSKTLPSDELQ